MGLECGLLTGRDRGSVNSEPCAMIGPAPRNKTLGIRKPFRRKKTPLENSESMQCFFFFFSPANRAARVLVLDMLRDLLFTNYFFQSYLPNLRVHETYPMPYGPVGRTPSPLFVSFRLGYLLMDEDGHRKSLVRAVNWGEGSLVVGVVALDHA